MHSVILYYVVQAQAAERHRQAQREAPARAASGPATPGRHGAGAAPAVSRPWRRAACAPCQAAAHDRAAHREPCPGAGRGQPARPSTGFGRAGRSDPGHGCGHRDPRQACRGCRPGGSRRH